MIKLLFLFFLTIPLSNSKAIGGLEVPDIGIGDLLGGSDKKEEENSKKSSPAGGAIGLIKTLTDEETIEEELEAGKIYASQLLGAVKIYENKELNDYVNKIGRHIANHTSRPDLPWTFAVLDTDGINAFAAPGGYIFLTKGLISILSTEDELAGVIGHEIAHVIKKHHYNVIKKQKVIEFGTEAISSAADNQIVGKLSGMMGQIMARGLDKESEYEADIDGMVISARSGYDASSLMSVLEKLQILKERKDEGMSFLTATHPTPFDRQSYLAEHITDELMELSIPSPKFERIKSIQKKIKK